MAGVINIDASLTTLDTMIAAIPEANRPIYTQMGQIMVALQRNMHAHIQENQTEFDQVEQEVLQIDVRLKAIENGNSAMQTQLAGITTSLDELKTQLTSPTLLLRTPALQTLTQQLDGAQTKVDDLVRRADAIGADGQSLVAKVSSLTDKVTAVEAAIASGQASPTPPGLDQTALIGTIVTAVTQAAGGRSGSGQSKWTPLQDAKSMSNIEMFNNDN